MLLTFPLMVAIQMVSALIGRVTGRGLAYNMGQVMPRPLVLSLLVLLFIANTINVGADLAAMGEAAKLVTGLNQHASTLFFALLSLGLQLFIPYRRYARLLTVLTFSLFAYVALLFFIHLDWAAIGAGADRAASQPDRRRRHHHRRHLRHHHQPLSVFLAERPGSRGSGPATRAPSPAGRGRERRRPQWRASASTPSPGMAVSNLIAIAIMIATAATLHAHGVTNINTAADAASALKPIAGRFAFGLFALGIIGTGLLAIPVLAGSTGYAVAEALDWKTGLDNMPWQARGFYSVIGAAILLGLGIDWSPIDPIKALYWSAVLNGVIAVPMMAALMSVALQPPQDGRIPRRLGAGRAGLAFHRGDGGGRGHHDICEL